MHLRVDSFLFHLKRRGLKDSIHIITLYLDFPFMTSTYTFSQFYYIIKIEVLIDNIDGVAGFRTYNKPDK